jgi:GAF domain-containing protein
LAADQAYLQRDPRIVALVELAHVRTYLLVPLLKDNELIGALGINREQVQPFTDRQIDLVTDFAAQATIALESTRRERQYREMQSGLAHITASQRWGSSRLRLPMKPSPLRRYTHTPLLHCGF